VTQYLGGRFSVRMRSPTAPKDVDDRWDAIFGKKGRRKGAPKPKTVVLVAKEVKSALAEIAKQARSIKDLINYYDSDTEIDSAVERIIFIAKTLHDGVK
jgi:hypothetical protein